MARFQLTLGMSLLDRFTACLKSLELDGRSALVAVSGGPDSVALLDLLVASRTRHGLDLVVAHLDHGMHPESARVAEQVRSLARSFNLPFELGHAALGASASETTARTQRYAWLEATRARIGADYIVTAHHRDDQIETVLMRALKGSGLAGLAGMTVVAGRVVRPLLPFSRAELASYVSEGSLDVWLDPANRDPRHLRSWIRTELLPLLRERLPGLESNVARLARHAAQDRAAWDAMLDAIPGLDLHAEGGGISVAASCLADYDSALKQALVLALARRVGCRLGPTRVDRVLRLLDRGLSGTRVPLGMQWSAELAFGRLRIYAATPEPVPEPLVMSGSSGSGSWGRWRFRWQSVAAPEQQDRTGLSAWFSGVPLTVRAWSAGERMKPLGGSGRRLLVRCFQEEKVPRSRRGDWPVLAHQDTIAWIPGVCRSDAQIPVPGTEALRVDAEYA
jgi:tRNA(Ile)-lysidine synthase